MKFAGDVSALSFLSLEEMSTEFVEFFFTFFPFGDIENHPAGELCTVLALTAARKNSLQIKLPGRPCERRRRKPVRIAQF